MKRWGRGIQDGVRNYLKKPSRKNILHGPDAPALPGTQPSTVTLSQYHKTLQVVRFINDNYRTDICLNAVAGEAIMSPAHFARIFKKVMGLPDQDYFNGRRITKAKNLLRPGTWSVTEIAVFLDLPIQLTFAELS